MNTASLITATDIDFQRNGRPILHGVNLAVHAHEIVSLIGPNGAGKSTLIRILLGLLQSDAGHVQRTSDLRIGYMPQRLHIDPSLPLTVERFLSLAGRHRDTIARCLALTGTEHLRKQSVQSLSGGELQRVLLARALFRKPRLLVLDEPAQGVDVAGQSALYQLINNIRNEWGCGVLMVSHDLHVVMATTDRVVCLNQHVCCEGHPQHVSSNPEFLRLFGESRNAGIATYTHHHNHIHEHDHHVEDEH